MNEHLIALLENSGFLRDGKPNLEFVDKASLGEIIDFCVQFSDISSYDNVEFQRSIYTHASSESLGGGRSPCMSLRCRSKKVEQLIQFAALYSDRVYIKNFLHDHVNASLDSKNNYWIFDQFRVDIEILSRLVPLIKSGHIAPITFQNICPHCLTVKSLRQTAENEYNKACRELEDKYYDKVNYKLIFDKGLYTVSATGPESLIHDGLSATIYRDKSAIEKSLPKLIKKLKSSKEIELTRAQAIKLKIGKKLAGETIKSAAFEIGSAQFLGTAFLTDNELEVEFIRHLTNDPIAKRRTALMNKYLNCLVPFIDNIHTTDLVKLRIAEEEAFILFRNAITKAVEEYKTHGSTFSERDAQAVYADIVQPHLTMLDAKIKKAKRHFIKDSRRQLIGWAGSISVGLYTGFFTADPLSGAAAFAASKAGAEFIEHLITKSDSEEEVKDDEWYFLWNLKRLSM